MPIRENPRIFISYARSDGRAFARDLRRRLTEDHGFAVWQDLSEMEGGKDWWKQIEATIRHPDLEYLVLVITENSLCSEVVRDEWRLARQEGKCVIPIVGAEAIKAQIGALPGWMKAAHFVDTAQEEQWQRFIRTLEAPCEQPRVPMMAAPPPVDFVPRPQEFEALRDLLISKTDGKRVSITAALKGAGGYGKTTLAKALCHDDAVQQRFHHGILWVTLGENPDLIKQILDLIEVLTGARPGYEDLGAASARLGELLSSNAYLLVIDDVWKRAHVEPFLRGAPKCGWLITTRNSDTLPRDSQRVQVDAMKSTEAVSLLRAGLPLGESGRIEALAARLGEWPLLLKLVNGVLAQRIAARASVAGALGYVEQVLEEEGFTGFDAADEADRDRAVEANLGLSIKFLTDEERKRFAELSIFPEDTEVPLGMVHRLWRATAGLSEVGAEKLCDRLFRLSLLLDLNLAAQTLRLHDVIRAFLHRRHSAQAVALHGRLLDSVGVKDWVALPYDEQYLWRRLSYHLKGAGREVELRGLLFNFDWLQGKLAAASINALLADFEFGRRDSTLAQLRQALGTAAHILGRDPTQLAGQLLARLIADAPEIAVLLEQAQRRQQGAWLRPLIPSLVSDPALVRTLEGHAHSVSAVAITADGKRVVSGSADNTLKIWELESGTLLSTLEGHVSSVRAVAITPNGKLAISGSWNNTLRVWELEAGALLGLLEGHTGSGYAVAITADGQQVVTGSSDNTVKVWDLATDALVRTLEGHTNSVDTLAITSDGRCVVSGSNDSTLKVWNLGTGALLRTLRGHAGSVCAVAVTPDGKRAVSGSFDNTLKVWELESGAVLRTLEGHAGSVHAVAITRDGKWAVSGSIDSTLKVWELGTGALVRTFEGHAGPVYTVAITPDGTRVVSGSADRTLKVWELETSPLLLRTPRRHADSVYTLAATPDGKWVVSASNDGTFKVWDVETGAVVRTLEADAHSVRAMAITPDGKRAVSASSDHTLKVWELETGALIRTLEGHADSVHALAITPDGERLVSGSGDHTLKVWELETGVLMRTLEGHGGSVYALAVTADGKGVVSGSSDRTLKMWELETGVLMRTLAGHVGSVYAVAITPDGKWAVSGSWDKTFRLWKLDTGALVRTSAGHTSSVYAVAVIMPHGKRAVSGSWDKTLKVWELANGDLLTSWLCDASIRSCAVSPDGGTIVAGDEGGRVHFLELVEVPE